MHDVFHSRLQHKIIGEALIVIQEIILDEIRAVAQTENEILVAKVGVILHDVPHDRAIANGNHGLRNGFRVFPQPHTKAAAEKDYLHGIPP